MSGKRKSEGNLQTFFDSIALREDSTSRFNYYNRFKYIHDVITLSRVPNAMTIVLWFLIFIFFDLTICGQAIPFALYSSLYPDDFVQDPSSEDFIFSELGVQQAAFVFIVLIFSIVLFQWISLIVYDGKLHLSVFVASVLNMSFFQLPHILSVISGILFGALSLATSGDRLTKHTSLFYCLILAGMTLLMHLNVYVFTATCEYNLVLRNGFFAHFELPFTVVDLMFIFTMDFFLALRVGPYANYMTIGSGLCIFWGVMTLLLQRRTVFLTFWPNLLLSKLPVDAIVFGLITILDILVKIPDMILMDLWIVMYLVDIGIAYFILSMNMRFTRLRFEPHSGHCFNPAKFVKKHQALMALRIGVSYGWREAIDPDFVKWIFGSFGHESMIPDVVRICLITGIPLSEMPWKQVVSPEHTTAVKFLAFQTELYMTFLANDGNEKLVRVAKTLSENSQRLETIGENFWTEADLDHRSIMDLGRVIRNTTRAIRNEASCYPKTPEIQEIWHFFCSSVLCAPSEYSSAFENVYWSLDLPYSFSLPVSEHKNREKMPTSSIERYVYDFTRKVSLPFHICLRLCTLIFFVIVISYNAAYVTQMKGFSNVFTNVSQLYILSASLGYHFLQNMDRFTELPSVDQIMATLNLDAQTATDFRSNFELKSPDMTNASQYLSLLEDGPPSPEVAGCNPISLSLMAVFQLPSEPSPSEVRCYKDIILQYIDSISMYADSQTSEVIRDFNVKLQDDRIIEMSLTAIMTVAFVVCLVILKIGQVKALNVLRKITSFNQHRFELREPGRAFSVVLLLVLWIAFMSAHLLMFEVLVIRTTETAELMQQKLVQMDLISDITRNGMSVMALVEYDLWNSDKHEDVQAEVAARSLLLLNSTHYVTKSGILDSFEDVFPLNCWSTPSAESFSVLLMDFGHLLLRGDISDTSYKFLLCRYWVVFNISLLGNQTLEEMMAKSLLSLQERSATFWLASIGFLFMGILIWILMEWIHSLHKLWFNGVRFLLRREMNQSPDRMRRLLELMTSHDGSFLERLPFAAIVKHRNVIVDCNEKAASFMRHSVEQAIGQKLAEFFPDADEFDNDDGKRLKMHTLNMDGTVELVRIQDMTASLQCEERHRTFLEAMKCELPLPFKDNVILISITMIVDESCLEHAFSTLSDAENEYQAVKRVLCCCNMYRAIVTEMDYRSADGFTSQVMSELKENVSIAVTQGVVVVTSLFDDGIATLTVGSPVERADRYLIEMEKGSRVVDPEIADHFSL